MLGPHGNRVSLPTRRIGGITFFLPTMQLCERRLVAVYRRKKIDIIFGPF